MYSTAAKPFRNIGSSIRKARKKKKRLHFLAGKVTCLLYQLHWVNNRKVILGIFYHLLRPSTMSLPSFKGFCYSGANPQILDPQEASQVRMN